MLGSMQKSPVVKSGGKMKNPVDELASAQSAFFTIQRILAPPIACSI